MAGTSWLAGPLAVMMIGTAVYCVSRLAAAWRWRRPAEYDVDAAHASMGVAMAGMLMPRLRKPGARARRPRRRCRRAWPRAARSPWA